MKEIDKKVHFVWIGNTLPPAYYHFIKRVTGQAKKEGFEVHLWVDNEIHFHKTAAKEDTQIPGINLRNIVELESGLGEAFDDCYVDSDEVSDDESIDLSGSYEFYENRDEGSKERISISQVLKDIIDIERVGRKNLAAASDILRLEILRQESGIYFDTDLETTAGGKIYMAESKKTHIQMFKKEFPPIQFTAMLEKARKYGFLMHSDVKFSEAKNWSMGNSIQEVEAKFRRYTNNCLLVAKKDHPILIESLHFATNRYIEAANNLDVYPILGSNGNIVFDEQGQVSGFETVKLNVKRSHEPLYYRSKYTVQLSGPELIRDVLFEYIEHTLGRDKIPSEIHHFTIHPTEAHVFVKCDASWVGNSSKKERPYDTDNLDFPSKFSIAKGKGIFSAKIIEQKNKDTECVIS